MQRERLTLMIIEVERISKVFNGRTIFKNLSYRFAPGKSYVIAGANGSGKSTVLRILAGLIQPSAGVITMEVEGKLLQHPHERGQYLGYISPDLNLYNQLSAFENLYFFASLKGMEPSRDSILALLTEVQLKGYAEQSVASFSTGMKQRLKLAYALLHQPAMLLLDEPATNLDQQGKELVEKIIYRQRDKGIVIMASNEPGEVEKYGEGIVCLDVQPVGVGT